MRDVKDVGLVMEGVGMRGVFTSGVLDYFMDQHIEFPYAVGVSAAAGNGLSYISKQRGRAKQTNIDIYRDYDYMGWKFWLKNRNIFDFDFLYHDIPEKILPYDYETYFSSKQRFEIVASNCLTGEASYLEEKHDKERVITIAKASASLPLLCPIVYVDDIPMLDGGITDSIPIIRSESQGYKKNVVILTRNKGYRKSEKNFKIPPFIYKKYPAMRQALANRGKMYNEQLDLVDQLESEGKILVLRPEQPIEVKRLEKDTSKLVDLYEEGYQVAKKIESFNF